MPVNLLLDSLRNRVPWPTMRAILKMCDLPMGRGWDDTIQRLIAKSEGENGVEDNFNKLQELYSNHLLVGEKAIKLFCVERQKINRLIASFQSRRVEETVFHETFPFPLPEERLKEIENSPPKLVEIKDFNDNLALIFCTKRFFTERVEINPEELRGEAKKDLGDYDELIGIKRYTRQFFDVIVLWKEKELVEIRVDIAQGMPPPERSRAFIETTNSFNSFGREILGIQTLLEKPINLFPLIDSLYESNEGKVGELAFTTDEGSTKVEKMRRGDVDLRAETYHKAGKRAVDHITPYRLAILWKFPISEKIETQPELFLPGQVRTLSSEQQLDEAIVRKCSSLIDYYFVFEKINIYQNNGG
jgi:hypothetical protein